LGCLSQEDLNEMNIELIRNTLYKAYLQDFYRYCQVLGGDTAEVMGEILQVLPLPLRVKVRLGTLCSHR
jgi:V-type H+-transporting ATPase subunit d